MGHVKNEHKEGHIHKERGSMCACVECSCMGAVKKALGNGAIASKRKEPTGLRSIASGIDNAEDLFRSTLKPDRVSVSSQ